MGDLVCGNFSPCVYQIILHCMISSVGKSAEDRIRDMQSLVFVHSELRQVVGVLGMRKGVSGETCGFG